MSSDTAMPFTTQEFKTTLATFMSGVTVVTTLDEVGGPRGFTASSFTSVSLSPPLVLVCIGKSASSYAIFSERDKFAINVLASGQERVSVQFASRAPDKFLGISWDRHPQGSPIISECAAWMDCDVYQRVDAGDHLVLIGRVLRCGSRPISALGYWRGSYFEPQLERMFERRKVGAILEHSGAIALVDCGHSVFDVPTASRLLPPDDPNSLYRVLHGYGAEAEVDFPFSIFEDLHGELMWIFYRGRVVSGPDKESPLRLVSFDDIGRIKFKTSAVGAMVQRFVKERNSSAFGVYLGDVEAGTVRRPN